MSKNNSNLDDLLDIPVVAELLHVSPRTVNRLINNGKGELPAVKIGGRWKIRAEDIEKYLLKKNANSASNLQKLESITNNRRSASPPKKGGENQNTETMSHEQATEQARRKMQLELDLKKQSLELQEKRIELEQKRIDYALQTAQKILTTLYPNMKLDGQQKDILLQALMQNLLQLGDSAELKLTFPSPRNSYIQQSEDILAIYEKIISLNPHNVLGYLGKGTVLSSLRRYEEALTAYEQAIRLDPGYADAYISKADALHSLRRYEETLAVYEQAICLNPDNIHAYKGKADALHSLQHYKEALAAYEQAIRLDPDNIHTYKSKADALHSLQHYKEALAAYEQVIHLDSNYAYAYKSKGDTLNNMGHHAEALVAYEQARQLGYRG